MRCIKITDRVGVSDLIFVLGKRALVSEWLAHDVWTVQEGDDGYFEDLCNSGRRMPGSVFIPALTKVIQVIDGRFEGIEAGGDKPWVIVESIDSSFHLLHAAEDVLSNARSRFPAASDYDAPIVPWRRSRAPNADSRNA